MFPKFISNFQCSIYRFIENIQFENDPFISSYDLLVGTIKLCQIFQTLLSQNE